MHGIFTYLKHFLFFSPTHPLVTTPNFDICILQLPFMLASILQSRGLKLFQSQGLVLWLTHSQYLKEYLLLLMLESFTSFVSATKRKQHFIVVDSAGVRLESVFQLCYALPAWPWSCYFNLLSLIWKMHIIIVPASNGCKNERDNICKVFSILPGTY